MKTLKEIPKWTAKRGHSAEIIHCADGTFCVLLHDDKGADAEGFGKTEDAAHVDALAKYKAARHRATLTASRAARRQIVGRG